MSDKQPTPIVTEDGYTLCSVTCPMLAQGWENAYPVATSCTIGEHGGERTEEPHRHCYSCEWRG